MRHSIKREKNDARTSFAESENEWSKAEVRSVAGAALKGICVLRTLVLVAAMVIGTMVAAAQTGYCGKSDVNDGKNVTWTLSDKNGDNTVETLTIAKSAEAGDGADCSMADWAWDDTNNTAQARPWQDYSDDIESVVVGEGVTTVGNYSFFGMTNLTSVSLASSVTGIGRGAFEGCRSLATVEIPAAVTTIGAFTFYDCTALTTVSGGSGVRRVGSFAFKNTQCMSGLADNGIFYVGLVACGLKGDGSGTLTIAEGTLAIGGNAFEEKHITGLALPESLEHIGESAFLDCNNLLSVTIPSKVSFIGQDAFANCEALSKVYLLPETPPELGGNYVFSGSGGEPLASQHFYVASEAYLATSDNAWYTLWNDMASNGWQKTGEDNATTAEAIAAGVSVATLKVTAGEVTTKCFTFDAAMAAAEAGYKSKEENNGVEVVPTITLLADIDAGTTSYFSRLPSLAMDLNGKTISAAGTAFLVVYENCSLAIRDGSTGETRGSIVSTYSGSYGGDVIYVNRGDLTAEGITIAGGKLNGIYNNQGTVTVKNCTVRGWWGIDTSGPTTISGGNISGTKQAIYLSNGTLNLNTAAGSAACTISGGEIGIDISGDASIYIGSGVSIKRCTIAGIYTTSDNITFTALPTFGTGSDKNGTDIWLANDSKITFAEGSYTAPAAPITISLADYSGDDPSATDLPKTFTVGYSDYVKSGSSVIDPAEVFAYKNTSAGFAVALNNDGEAAIYRGVTFAFAEGQTWMTWCDEKEYSMPSGITAYRITGVSGTSISVEEGSRVTLPAYEPLLLKKKDSGSLTAVLIGAGDATGKIYDEQTGIVRDGDQDFIFFGATQAVDETTMTPFWAAGRSYMLRGGEFVLIDDITDGISANRCWLTINAETGSNAARRLSIGSGTTGIEAVTPPLTPPLEGAGSWYDLQGRRLSGQPTQKGIYVNGGRKVVVR